MAVDVQVPTAELLKVLGEPARWQIVRLLGGEELCVCHLVEELDLPQPLVSHHLRVLRDAGVVERERFRQWMYYRLSPGALDGVARELAAATNTRATQSRRPCC